jgi:TRAP-type C4-dicarboxylate transport system substrate-binding protein
VQILDLPFIFRDEAHAIKANAMLTKALAKKFEHRGSTFLASQ